MKSFALLLFAGLLLRPSSAADDSFGFSRFYYTSLESDELSFYVNKPFSAQFVEPRTGPLTSVSWVYDSALCSMTPQPSTVENRTVLFSCTEAGQHKFQVYSNNDANSTDTFYVTMTFPDGCYQWYFVTGEKTNGAFDTAKLNKVPRATNDLEALAWITDPNNLSTSERSGNATEPSAISRQLSTSFHSIGEFPVLKLTAGIKISPGMPVWDDGLSVWRIPFNTSLATTIPIYIISQGSSLMNCRVADGSKEIFVKSTETSLDELLNPVLQSASPKFLRVVSDPCAYDLSYAISSRFPDTGIITSENEFLDSSKVKMLPASVGCTKILSVVPTQMGLTFKCSNGVFWTQYLTSFITPSGLTGSGFTFRGVSVCDVTTSGTSISSPMNSWVFAIENTKFHLSEDGGKSYSEKALTGVTKIHDIEVIHVSQQVALLCKVNGVDKIMFWGEPVTEGFSFGILDAKGSSPRLATSGTNSGELLIYGDDLYYSPNGGLTATKVILRSRDRDRPAPFLNATEYIKEVKTSSNGDYAVLTSDMRVFYGKIGVEEAIELIVGLGKDSASTVYFDFLNRLTAYEVTRNFLSDGIYVTKRLVPVYNQIHSDKAPIAQNKKFVCPYISRSIDLSNEYYLDIGENFTFTASLTPMRSFANGISIAYSSSSLLNVSTKNTEEFSSLSMDASDVKTRLIQVNITTTSSNSAGMTDIRVRPHEMNLGCEEGQSIGIVRLACPPNRSIRVRVPQFAKNMTCLDAPTVVEYAQGSWFDWIKKEFGPAKSVPYDCSVYGVPIPEFYGTFWAPKIDLYDGNTFVETVPVDFTIFENYGRDTYRFNMTAAGANCLRKPQTWAQFMTQPDPISAWTKANYEPCYVKDKKSDGISATAASGSYEIVNGSNYNAVTWTGGKDSVYLFTAVVLDPTYSYCQLRTKFAVSVYGSPLSAGIQTGIVVGLTTGIIGILGASFFWLRRQRIKEKERELKEAKKSD